MHIRDFTKMNKELLPKTDFQFRVPQLKNFDYGFEVARDFDFLKPQMNIITFFDQVKADWREIERFEFKHMDIEKTFNNLIRKI
ncbi:MAG TPA: hypothetical protein VJH97_02860 [Candidatus Nanoarchaeia archaeon]|nr:hypothetical protein [Candidatus Nanoarchaeia archaeon]